MVDVARRVTRRYAARDAAAVVSWYTLVWLLVIFSTVDAVGLLIGDQVYGSRSYDVLRTYPGGIRTLGLLLIGVVLLLVHGLGRGGAWARAGLLSLLCWYLVWTGGLIAAWMVAGQVLAWRAAVLNALVATVIVLCVARAPRGEVHRVTSGR